jgi:hypothetical protein
VAGLLGITIIGAVLRTEQSASLRSGSDPVHAFVDGYHTSLIVTIVLMAAGVVVSYLTLRPRRSAEAVTASEITAVNEAEGVGEALGELIVPAQLPERMPSSRTSI